MTKIPDYVLKARAQGGFAYSLEKALDNCTTEKLRDHSFDKDAVLPILTEFAKAYKYGILPDKLVCYRIYVDDETGNRGELGLTFVPVYKCWEFYARNLDKHSRVLTNFKTHLAENGFKFKTV